MPYRKRRGYDAWHWCRNCSGWPTSDYDEQQGKPASGELCNECKAKGREQDVPEVAEAPHSGGGRRTEVESRNRDLDTTEVTIC